MVDIVPALLLTFGVVAFVKPSWVAAVDRRQKAAGTTRRPEDVELTESHYSFIRVVGLLFGIFGLVFTVQSL